MQQKNTRDKKKIPFDVFCEKEQKSLQPLPNKRYEILKIEQRKVNNYGHISFKDNFYSVPYNFIGKTLTIKSTDILIKIYDDINEVAIHGVCDKKGEFISSEEHKPPEKRRKTEQEYILKAMEAGNNTYKFLIAIKSKKPFCWHRIMKGIFNLHKSYSEEIVDSACKRAIEYNAISYTSVQNICSNNLYNKPKESLAISKINGFAHNLKLYDDLLNK